MRSGAVVYSACWCDLLDAAVPVCEIRGSDPNRVRELESSDPRVGFPDPVSFDRLPLPVLGPSRIPDGFPRYELSGDAGSPVVLELRRQRPGDERHSVGQRNCNEHPRLARQHTGQSKESVVSTRRAAFRTTDIAPVIISRLRSRWPILDILPSLGLPPVVCAALERARAMRRSCARAESSPSAAVKAWSAIAVIGRTSGIVMRRTASSSWRALVCTSFSNPRIFSSRPAICSSRRPASSRTCSGSPEHGSSSAEAKRLTCAGPCGAITPNSAKWPRKRVDRLRPLAYQKIARTEQHPSGLLLFRLHGHEAHGRALCCLGGRLRVGHIVLLTLDEWLHV